MKNFFLLSIFCWSVSSILFSQNADNPYFTISGTVKNANNKSKIEYVNISVLGANIGTITNENGEFSLKIPKNLNATEIEFSCLGFFNSRYSIDGSDELNRIFLMQPRSIALDEVKVVSWKNPEELVLAAIDRIEMNYSSTTNSLTAFYRETVQKSRKYINLSEAVISVYKSPYNQDVTRDKVEILKGRNLISQMAKDTLAVKLLGGPTMPVNLDVVKNPDFLLDREAVQFYAYKIGEAVSINDRLQFVVNFSPKITINSPLYIGTFYIDAENLAFTRIEFQVDMSDKQKVTEMILRRKPVGLRFSPTSVGYIVDYKPQDDNKFYLNYVRAELKFKCDWRRRLFATNYTVVAEMVVTDMQQENVEKIPNKNAFKLNESLSDNVTMYYDKDFWGAYNIIEPTESLESAVGKLKKTD